MKEMYLKVNVENNDYNDFRDVYYRDGVCFMCHKDDKKLVEIEDAESKGAEKLLYAINRLALFVNSDGKDRVEELFGHANIEMILREFAPHRIIELVKELNYHVPAVGDIYASRNSNYKVAVMSYDKNVNRVSFMARSFVTNSMVDDFNKAYLFTGCNYNDFSNILNELEGDNT